MMKDTTVLISGYSRPAAYYQGYPHPWTIMSDKPNTRKMSYGSTDQRAVISKVEHMRTQTDEVKGLLTQNIEKVIQRGDRLDQLEDRADKLMHDSGRFHSGARRLKSKLWWQNTKLWIILIIIVLVILLIVGASIAIPLGLKYGKKS
ncbi:hypothetical protein EMCRGX_G017336 [Ephydatia muelleri]